MQPRQGRGRQGRPRKGRRVCCLPENTKFGIIGKNVNTQKTIYLHVEEYECIRLIDYENLMQEECAELMNVARTTVQRIYFKARKKIASALVDGHILKIEGGNYELCDGSLQSFSCRKCKTQQEKDKKEIYMKIAIPVNDKNIEGGICTSFGRAPYYLFYTTDIKNFEYLANPAAAAQGGAGIKASQFIVDNQADAVITPRCGDNAAEVLISAKIDIYKSQGEAIQENLTALENNKLEKLDQFHGGFHGHQG